MNGRRWVVAFIGVLAPLAACLVLGELVLRVLPVHSALERWGSPARYRPSQTYTYSHGWDLHDAQTIHTNAQGWVAPFDYDSTDTRPLLAIVGDSYVEALMVPWDSSLSGRLARHGRVYPFGVSGAPLSQYLAQSQAAARFHPAALVVVIIGNDFDESLERYRIDPRFWTFHDSADGLAWRPPPQAPPTSRLKRFVKHSELLRYLALNLHLQDVRFGRPKVAYAGNTNADTDAHRVTLSRQAIKTFLTLLPAASGLPPDQIAFVVDAIRPALYTGDGATGTYAQQMRDAFLQEATARGFEVIDMAHWFREQYARDHVRFEFADDNHWNAEGHRVAATAVMASTTYQRTVSP